MHKTIKDYFYFFSNERLDYLLNYKSPIQYRTELTFK
ncbi:MAG: IS3 family transposase [Anaeroplasmataceae bacterium]|nr:IS3 family transposase [Anaeroplasmataceae bacterium]